MSDTPIQSKSSLVLRAERFLRTDLTYLVRGGSWLALGQFVATISVFVLAVAFANLVPKETYGTYKYVQSVAGILAIFGMTGINTYIAQAVARGAHATFLSGLHARITWGLLGGLGGLVVAGYYFFMGNALLGESFLIVAVATPFVDALGLYNVYLQSRKFFRTSIIYFSIMQAASSACILIAVLYTSNLLILVGAYFLPPILLRLFFHLRTLVHYPPNDVDDPKAVRYGAHLSVVNVLGTLATYIDAIVLYHLLGAVPVALYSFALAPVDQIRTLYSKNLPSLALPKLANRSMKSINGLLFTRIFLLAGIGLLIAGIYVLIVPYAFAFFFPKYLDAVMLSKALSVLLLVALPATYLATALQAKIHIIPPSWLYFAIVPDLLHVAALIIFVPQFGVYGVVIAKGVDVLSGFLISLIQWNLLSGRPEPAHG